MIVSNKPVDFIDMSPNDLQHFACEPFEGQRHDHVKVALAEHLPPGITKDKPYAFNGGHLSHFSSLRSGCYLCVLYVVLCLTLI